MPEPDSDAPERCADAAEDREQPEAPERRHRRYAVSLPVRISSIDPETDPRTGRPFFRASREICANLSRGGLFIHTQDPPSPGHRVLVEMHFPDGTPLEAVGRIAWSKVILAPGGETQENGVGVEFVGAPPDQLSALETFLADGGAEE